MPAKSTDHRFLWVNTNTIVVLTLTILTGLYSNYDGNSRVQTGLTWNNKNNRIHFDDFLTEKTLLGISKKQRIHETYHFVSFCWKKISPKDSQAHEDHEAPRISTDEHLAMADMWRCVTRWTLGPAFSLPWPEMKDDFRKGTAGKLTVCSGKWPKYILFICIYLFEKVISQSYVRIPEGSRW